MDAPDDFTLERWICRRCQWAIFWERDRRENVLVVSFLCGYPDSDFQREAAESGGDRPQCPCFLPRTHDWPLADRNYEGLRVFSSELPEED